MGVWAGKLDISVGFPLCCGGVVWPRLGVMICDAPHCHAATLRFFRYFYHSSHLQNASAGVPIKTFIGASGNLLFGYATLLAPGGPDYFTSFRTARNCGCALCCSHS